VKSEAFPGKGPYYKWIRLALVETENHPGAARHIARTTLNRLTRRTSAGES
jgi:hypothetical protein